MEVRLDLLAAAALLPRRIGADDDDVGLCRGRHDLRPSGQSLRWEPLGRVRGTELCVSHPRPHALWFSGRSDIVLLLTFEAIHETAGMQLTSQLEQQLAKIGRVLTSRMPTASQPISEAWRPFSPAAILLGAPATDADTSELEQAGVPTTAAPGERSVDPTVIVRNSE